MKKVLYLLSAALLFTCAAMITSCKDEDEQTKTTYFTLTIDNSYNTTASELWVMLHDQTGNPLGAKSFHAGDVVIFDSITPPAKFSVTLAHYFASNLGEFNFITYLGESQGASWTLRSAPAFNGGTVTGSFQVTVSDPQLGSPYDGVISDGNGFGFQPSLSNTSFVQSAIASSNRKYLISLTDNSGNPRYKFLEHAPTTDVNYTLSDFAPFDRESVLNFPATPYYFIYTLGFDAGQYPSMASGYMTNIRYTGSFDQIERSSVKLGFLNRFANHLIYAFAPTNSGGVGYEAYGSSQASSINVQNDIDIHVTSHEWSNFSLSANNFSWFRSFWRTGAGSDVNVPVHSWAVYGSDASFNNPAAFSSAFTSAHPEIDIASFAYSQTDIFTSTRTFAQYINSNFKGQYNSPYEDRYKSEY